MLSLREWYFVRFDDSAIALQVNPPDGVAWAATIPWERIIRICFRTGDWFESDEIYIFTDERLESYLIPIEAWGGRGLWYEILERKLFDTELAIEASTTKNELFCSSPEGEQAEASSLSSPTQLPELEGETLILSWDQIEADSLILQGDSIIWQEKTGWEVYDRFAEIAAIFKQKYGKRLIDIVPTPRSLYALYGDSTAAYFHVTSTRESLGKETSQDTTTDADGGLSKIRTLKRLLEIRDLLHTALYSEEEYLEENVMGVLWPKSCARDAAAQLADLLGRLGPTNTAEIKCCVEAVSDPGRIKQGKSKELLIRLSEKSHPILNALANSTDPQLRIFAIETANTSVNPSYFSPLYGSLVLKQRLLNDPDENVRVVAITTSKQTIDHNANYLKKSLQSNPDDPLCDLFHQLLARLSDSSAKVRAAAAKTLGVWASHAGHEALDGLLKREHDPEAREALAMAKALYDPALQDEHGL